MMETLRIKLIESMQPDRELAPLSTRGGKPLVLLYTQYYDQWVLTNQHGLISRMYIGIDMNIWTCDHQWKSWGVRAWCFFQSNIFTVMRYSFFHHSTTVQHEIPQTDQSRRFTSPSPVRLFIGLSYIGLKWRAHTYSMGHHDWYSNPGFHGCESSSLPVSRIGCDELNSKVYTTLLVDWSIYLINNWISGSSLPYTVTVIRLMRCSAPQSQFSTKKSQAIITYVLVNFNLVKVSKEGTQTISL